MKLVCVKKVLSSIRDIILSVIILYMAEILGMMAGALIYEVMPRNALSQYLYIIISTAAYLALILGIVLCLIRLKTGTLLAPMVFHVLWNSVFFGIINIGAKPGSDTIIAYVTESPFGDLIPLVTSLLLLFVIKKLDLKKAR